MIAMKTASTDEAGEISRCVAALAHRLDERAAEQDQHARRRGRCRSRTPGTRMMKRCQTGAEAITPEP